MSTTIEPFVLDAYAKLFRDAGAFQEFVNRFESACQSGATPFFSGGRIVGVSVSKETGKRLLCDHIMTQWIKDPSHLNKLVESLQEEPVSMTQE
ncbi:MAG TPA: hypothetical protein VHY22_11535 [Chthoniobacteraceae bacterium]|jgi:hypothetical protein|nr:hypothetical protein [Chthoniobacteraceae bacterium]